MNVTVEEKGDAVIINLTGDMMLGYEANDFHEAILKAVKNNRKKIIVDLSNVQFISSWGIGILIYGYTTTINAGGKFIIAAVPGKVKDVLVKTRLDSFFEKYDSVESALRN